MREDTKSKFLWGKSPHKTHALVAVLLGILVIVAYSPTLGLSFMWDDFPILQKITDTQSGAADWEKILSDFYGPLLEDKGAYRPLYSLVFGLDFTMYGVKPFGYHLTTIALHAANSFLVYLLALELVESQYRNGIALTAGALFALHPVHPESVSWISGRVDVICSIFLIMTLILFLRWLRPERRSSLLLIAALASFILALMSKETAAVIPGLLFLCALYRRVQLKTAFLGVVPFAIVLGIYLLFRSYVLADAKLMSVAKSDIGLLASIWGLFYRLIHVLVPINFGLLPTSILRAAQSPLYFGLFSCLVLAAVAYAVYKAWDRRLAIVLITLSVVPLMPVFTVLAPDPLLNASRWSYIPSVFLSVFLSYAIWTLAARRERRWAVVGSLTACTVFMTMLFFNNTMWMSAGEIAEGLLTAEGTPTHFPVRYRSAAVFPSESYWHSANNPPFERQVRSPGLISAAGEIERVNPNGTRLTLRLSGGKGSLKLNLDSERTDVTLEGEPASAAELRQGRLAVVTYYEMGYEKNLVQSVELIEGLNILP